MTTFAPPRSPTADRREHDTQISRVPYLPGLDGMRALAVIAVMIYHANPSWLPGGFLGVEMFFVISGYLITLLIIAERERTYTVSLIDFWKRRARRLLPALGVLLVLVAVYTVIFEPSAVGQLRGDVVAGLLYGSNWYQLLVGLGYTAAFDFAPLRHLWSLAVEEQFYLVWPVVMVVLLGRKGTRRVADVSRWLFIAAVGIAIATALLYHPGVIGEPEQTPEAYWFIGGRAISKLDFLYIGTFSRASGILLGAAFAMLWRPFAVMRGPLRDKGWAFDAMALMALGSFSLMCWQLHLVTPEGAADERLFRGGLFFASFLTVVMIAAISHPGGRANRVVGNPLLTWIGVRSYGLYLYHWPIYQAIRKLAGNKLTIEQFALAMVITAVVTELSFRFVETPVRTGAFGDMVRRARRNARPAPRRILVGGVAVVTALSLFAGVSLATADLEQNEIADAFADNAESTTDLTRTPSPNSDGRDSEGGVVGEQEGAPATSDDPDPTVAPTTIERETVLTTLPATFADDPPLNGGVDEHSSGTSQPESATTVVPAESVPPPTTAPPVPASADPPGPTPPVEPAPSAVTSLGVVTDPAAITPLAVPPQPPAPAIRLVGFGDSVMLGSAGRLAERGFVVDAVQSRQFSRALPELQAIRDNGFLGSAVVVHLGTNGSFPQASLDQMMGILADVPIVVFVTGKADRVWIADNNAKIRALPSVYPDVTVLDWEVIGPQCPGDCFYDDQIHLNGAGQTYYADLIARLLGL
ncbi:MAG: acyltransferase family protein [Ilumatobacter sp.]